MSRMLKLGILLMTLALPATARADCPGADVSPVAGAERSAASAVTCLVNLARTSAGLAPVRVSPRLTAAATGHSADMLAYAAFTHAGRGGLAARARAAGYRHFDFLGEALGVGTLTASSPMAIVAAWLASPEHRPILLAPSFRDIGVGVVTASDGTTSGAAYTADFGLRSPRRPSRRS